MLINNCLDSIFTNSIWDKKMATSQFSIATLKRHLKGNPVLTEKEADVHSNNLDNNVTRKYNNTHESLFLNNG